MAWAHVCRLWAHCRLLLDVLRVALATLSSAPWFLKALVLKGEEKDDAELLKDAERELRDKAQR